MSVLHMKIFFFCCHSSTDMSFRLIYIQYGPRLAGKSRIQLRQTFCDIFMYRTLADSKFLRCISYCCFTLNNIICCSKYPLFYIFFQGKIPRETIFTMYAKKRKGIHYQEKYLPKTTPSIIQGAFPVQIYFSVLKTSSFLTQHFTCT